MTLIDHGCEWRWAALIRLRWRLRLPNSLPELLECEASHNRNQIGKREPENPDKTNSFDVDNKGGA